MVRLKTKCMIIATVFFAIALNFFWSSLPVWQLIMEFVYILTANIRLSNVILCMIFGFLSYLCYDISKLHLLPNLSLLSNFKIYSSYKVLSIIGAYMQRKLLSDKSRIEKSQQKRLFKILKHCKSTAYSQSLNLGSIRTVEEFRKTHPITTHSYYEPWTERILNGESNILFPEIVDYFCATSGTTSGKSKLYPKNKKATSSRYFCAFFVSIRNLLKTPKAFDIKYIFDFRLKSPISMTNNNVERGPGTMLTFKKFHFVEHIPFIAKDITDLDSAFYVNLIFALKEREIGIIFFPLASHMYSCLRYLESNWRQICNDIRLGEINKELKCNDAIISALQNALYPAPDRATELEKEFMQGFQDIIPRVWPNVAAITSILTGPFAVYKRLIQDRYSAHIPMRSGPHVGTESLFGVNAWESLERDGEFLPLHIAQFFEFIPEIYIHEDQPPTLLLHELEYGENYEMVITNYDGLCRYRTNDLITISGFEDQIPCYTFSRRINDILTLHAEKTPLNVISKCIEEFFEGRDNISLIDYSCVESPIMNELTGVKDMKYIVLVEKVGAEITSEDEKRVDELLQTYADGYRFHRQNGQIEQLHFISLERGMFDELRHYIVAKNNDASILQVKIPRKIVNVNHLKVLLGKTD